jgi:hypothetical protein
LEVVEVLFVLKLKVSLLLVSTLEDEGYGFVFEHEHVLIFSEVATLDTSIVLGVKQWMFHRLLGQPMCESKGILDLGLVLVIGGIVKSLSWYEKT